MITILNLLSQVIENYLRVQLVLLPLYGAHFFLSPKQMTLSRQMITHNVLLFGSLLIPFLLFLWPAGVQALPVNLGAPVVAMYAAAGVVDRTLNSPSCFSIFSFFSVVSIIGALNFARLLFLQFLRERTLQKISIKTRRLGRIRIFISPAIATPFSTGIFGKRIYLPSRLLDDQESIQPILKHEIFHIRRKHILFALAEKAHLSLGWYNPLSHLLALKGHELRELLCDEAVLAKYPRIQYGRILLREAENCSHHRSWALINNFFMASVLRKRISNILDQQKPSGKHRVALGMSFASLASVLLFIAAVPQSSLPPDRSQQGIDKKIEAALLETVNDDMNYIISEIKEKNPSAVLENPHYDIARFWLYEGSRLYSYSISVDFYYLKDIQVKQVRKYRYSPHRREWERYYKSLRYL